MPQNLMPYLMRQNANNTAGSNRLGLRKDGLIVQITVQLAIPQS